MCPVFGGRGPLAHSAEHKEAVIAIQGGGVYGLSLVGQLQALLQDHGYKPLALAGTSAGAIVATLAWAGLSPQGMQKLFAQMAASKKQTLVNLLAPYLPDSFDLRTFKKLESDAKEVLRLVLTKDHGFFKPDSWKTAKKALALLEDVAPHYSKRGFFTGANLESEIERWLRTFMPRIGEVAPTGEAIRFSHVTKLMERYRLYHPPLLLTVTNLTKKRIQIVSSIDPEYANVPVAKAVRASAGFPVFLTPIEIPECPEGGWFVDGGLVSNFPIWTFSEALRQKIQKSDLEDIYGHLVNKPWIRVGLRVVDDVADPQDLTSPELFFRSLGSMLVGGARNELEDLLAEQMPRSVFIKQKYSETGGPADFLDVLGLDEAKVNEMVEKGRTFANQELETRGSPVVIPNKAGTQERVTRQLDELTKKCEFVFGSHECRFRANVFMPVRAGTDVRMRLVYSVKMEGDTDSDMEFPDLQSGATGFCYWSRRPHVCNLQRIDELWKSDPDRLERMLGGGPTYDLYGMDAKLQRKVREDRTWLASMPIFDPHEVSVIPRDRSMKARRLKHVGQWGIDIETEMEGPLLGVLNLDAGWDYATIKLSDDPNRQFADMRVQAVLAIMQATSFAVARSLGGEFPE